MPCGTPKIFNVLLLQKGVNNEETPKRVSLFIIMYFNVKSDRYNVYFNYDSFYQKPHKDRRIK